MGQNITLTPRSRFTDATRDQFGAAENLDQKAPQEASVVQCSSWTQATLGVHVFVFFWLDMSEDKEY